MTTLLLILLCYGDKWPIRLDDYKVYKEGLLAASEDGAVCYAVPWNNELLFFDADAKLMHHYKRDNDAPNGFRQITALGFLPETKQFYVYDFGRKISFWSETGDFEGVHYIKPLLYHLQLFGDRNLLYVTNISGSKGTTPTLLWQNPQHKHAKTISAVSPLTRINGYAHKSLPRPPLKMPWHHHFLLARGRDYFVSCYNRDSIVNIANIKTLVITHSITINIPAIPVEDRYYKETLTSEAKKEKVYPYDLKLDHQPIFHPVPLQILMDSADRIFVYGKSFDGFIRLIYTIDGSLHAKEKVEKIPACMNQKYHYYLTTHISGLVISKNDAPKVPVLSRK